MSAGAYLLVSAARNEEAYIERTLQAVIAQTHLPTQWLIMSDGSTDRTDEIVKSYAARYPFINLHRLHSREERNFGSKARAINTGYESLRHLEHEFVGILDVDVTFPANYYEAVISYMDAQRDLGIAGGILYDLRRGKYVRPITAINWSVSGAIQMFREQCWQQIGGYVPIRGGIDAAAEVMARMHGWKVQAFPALPVLHHRQMGSQGRGTLARFFFRGFVDYQLGYHPLFFFLHALYRLSEAPPILGATTMLAGFLWASLKNSERQVPPYFVSFLRQEQMGRLQRFFKSTGKTAT